MTLQIRALEEGLGVRLFDRAGGRVALTPQGATPPGYARDIARLTGEAGQKLETGDGKAAGAFAPGVSTTIAHYVLPRLMGA